MRAARRRALLGATRARVLRPLGRQAEAQAALETAVGLTDDDGLRDFLRAEFR